MASNQNQETSEIGEDLRITRARRRPAGGQGRWVSGSLGGFRFEALVFPAHAEQGDYELLGDSRISKLWVRRISDRVTVFNWDRGQDVPAANAEVESVVRFLADGLAESTFGKE
jgi:hypothetical protein